jgi:hypothetical protein
MRAFSLLLLGVALAACSTTAMEPTRSAKQQEQLSKALAGKVAGPPVSCLPSYLSKDNMTIIDDSTLLFRQGARTVYVNNLRGPCSNLSAGHYALVTRQFGGSGMCRGDIAEVADLTNGFIVGSCSLGDFVPYATAGK